MSEATPSSKALLIYSLTQALQHCIGALEGDFDTQDALDHAERVLAQARDES